MKKVTLWISIFFLLILVLIIGSYASLNTKYAPYVVNFVANLLISEPIKINQVEYSYKNPREITLYDVYFGQEQDSAHIPRIDALFATNLVQKGKFHFKRLTIADMSVQSIEKLPIDRFSVYIDEMLLKDIKLTANGFNSEKVDLYIEQPQFGTKDPYYPFYGRFELTTDLISYQNEQIHNLNIAGYISPQQADISRLAFNWQQARVYIKARKVPNDPWRFATLKVSKLALTQSQLDLLSQQLKNDFISDGVIIEQMEVADSSIQADDFHINQFNATASNLRLPFEVWKQQDLDLSIKSADFSWKNHTFDWAQIDLNSKGETFTIENLTIEGNQSSINVKGQLASNHIDLENLSVMNMDWLPSMQEQQDILNYFNKVDNVAVKNISIRSINTELSSIFSSILSLPSNITTEDADTNNQAQQTPTPNTIKFTGLDINAENVNFKKSGHWGLWQGKLKVNAENINYQNVVTKLFLLSLYSEDGVVYMDRFVAPTNEGLLEGKGEVNLNEETKPWTLDMDITGIPLSLIKSWDPLQITFDGIVDGNINIKGLYDDKSATDNINGLLAIRINDASTTADLDAAWQQNQDQETLRDLTELAASEPISVQFKNPIEIKISKNELKIETLSFSSADYMMLIDSNYNLITPENSQFNYRLYQGCQAVQTMMQPPETQALYEDLCVGE